MTAEGKGQTLPGVCRHFGKCGGCDWQDVSYADQLLRKQARLQALLDDQFGRRAPRVEPVAGMTIDPSGPRPEGAAEATAPWGFRRKAAFVFAPTGGAATRRRPTPGFVMGHFARGSREVVPIGECPVHAPRANRIAFALARQLTRAQISAAGPRLDGVLRHLIVRTTSDDQEAVAMLVVTRNDKALRAPLRAFLAGPERPTGFFLNIHDRPGAYMVGPESLRLDGRSHVREEVAGRSFLLSPTAFFQTNTEAAATLVGLITAAVGAHPQRVLDLYAGSGLFAVPLAVAGHTVTAVEENRVAVADGERNLGLNRVPPGRLRFVAAPVEQALVRLGRDACDLVVLDPPREGCSPEALEAIFTDLGPPRAVYVSCDPQALVRDLAAIVDAGYTVTRVQPVDMFPHTTHIETVVTLERSPAAVHGATLPKRGR